MLSLLVFGDYQAKFLDGSYRSPVQFGTLSVQLFDFTIAYNSPATPWEAQMLCWLASGELDCVFLEDYGGTL